MIETRLHLLQPGQGVQRGIQRLVAIRVAMDGNALLPERQHPVSHLVPRQVIAQPVGSIEVAREVQP